MLDPTRMPPDGNKSVRDDLVELAGDDRLVFFAGFDHCIIGLCSIHGMVPRVSYSVEAIVETLQKRDGMTHEDALEHYEFNIGACFVGPYTPAMILAAPGVEIETDNE
jgi:hypothetical protein